MAKKTQKARKAQTINLDETAELRSFLPKRVVVHGRPPQFLKPYLKSFISDKEETVINGSVLKYTACSTNKWVAPTSRASRRRAIA